MCREGIAAQVEHKAIEVWPPAKQGSIVSRKRPGPRRTNGVVLECTAWSEDLIGGFVLECTACTGTGAGGAVDGPGAPTHGDCQGAPDSPRQQAPTLDISVRSIKPTVARQWPDSGPTAPDSARHPDSQGSSSDTDRSEMRGDTGALRRMQIQDSRHDRAAHVLDQTKRKRRNYQSCADHQWHVIA